MIDTHLAHMVHNQAARYGSKTALRYKSGDHWHDISYQSLGERIRTAAKALLELGVLEGEMVGICSGNRPEWSIADFAILSTGAVSVPIYATSTAGQAGYIVNDADLRFLFVGNQTQYDRITSILEKLPTLTAILVFDDGADLRGNPKGMHFSDFWRKAGHRRGMSSSTKGFSALLRTIWPRSSTPRAPRESPRGSCSTTRTSTTPSAPTISAST